MPVKVQTEKAILISKAYLTLHSLLRDHYGIPRHEVDEEDDNYGLVPGTWRTDAVMQEVKNKLRAPRANAGG